MLTIEDCIELSGLSEDEIDAIAEHEHISEIAAAELGAYLLTTPDGEARIATFIREDIRNSRARGDLKHAAMLRHVLKRFLATHHPAADRAAAE